MKFHMAKKLAKTLIILGLSEDNKLSFIPFPEESIETACL